MLKMESMHKKILLLSLVISIGWILTIPTVASAAACPNRSSTKDANGIFQTSITQPTSKTCDDVCGGYAGGTKHMSVDDEPGKLTCCCKQVTSATGAAGGAGPAGGGSSGGSLSLANPLGSEDIPQIIGKVVNMILGITGSIALLMFVVGGIIWLTSTGEEKRIKKGWDTMMWAGMGLIVVFGAYIIVKFILDALLRGAAS